jgi:hypothetical protein
MKRKQFAVNIGDLTTGQFRDPFCPARLLLQPVLDKNLTQVECEPGRFDGVGVLVAEDVDPERWAAILTILRNGLGRMAGIPKHALRIYEGSGRTWKRI